MSKQNAVQQTASRSFRAAIEATIKKRVQGRQQRARQYETLLPPDLTGTVFNSAREEAAKVKERLVWLDSEISKTEAALKNARRAVFKACPPAVVPAKFTGDILSDYQVEPARPHPKMRVKTAEAIKLSRETVTPLELYRKTLIREVTARQMELGDLKKIATLAFEGSPALVNFLNKKWTSRLEIGFHLLSDLPPAALLPAHYRPTDRFGNDLPGEADLGKLSGTEVYRENV